MRLPRGRPFRVVVVLLVLALLAVVGVVLREARSGTTKPAAADLAGNTVDVVGCPHPEQVQVAARSTTRTTRQANSAVPTMATPLATSTPSPTPTPSPTNTPTATPRPTATISARPTLTLPPTFRPIPLPTPTPTPTARLGPKPYIAPAMALVHLDATAAPTATVSAGRFHLDGLTPGRLYQVGAQVPGCSGAKVVVANHGFFVAGRTQVPPVAVVRPAAVSVTGSTAQFDAGAPAHWTLSTGGSPQTCASPAGALAHGDTSTTSGSFQLPDPLPNPTAQPGAPYGGALHLTVTQKTGPCAPSLDVDLPIVQAGLPQSGITQLEVYDLPYLDTVGYGTCDVCQPGPYNTLLWKGYSAFDWDDPKYSQRPFHWASSAVGTADGMWQLSEGALPATCRPGGVIASGRTGYAPGMLSETSQKSPPNFTVDFAGRGLDHSKVYRLRVVPVDAKGNCTGPASPPMKLSWQPAPAAPTFPKPNPPPQLAHVQTALIGFQKLTGQSQTPPYCFQALTDHTVTDQVLQLQNDIVGWLTLGQGGHAGAGEEVCWEPSADSSGGSFWDDLTDVVDFIVDVVSFPAKVYDLYEQIIPGILGELIPGCSDTCKSYLLTAEKVGLAAVGLPPSLPDASAIVNDGEGYLVEQASEATGVPQPAVKAAFDAGKQAMVNQLSAVSSNQTGLTCDWCAFDNGVRAPAVKVLVTRSVDDDPGLPLPARICVEDSAHKVSSPNAYWVAAPLYYGGCADLPKHFPPGSVLILRLGLTANLEQIREKALDDFYASQSELGGSPSEIDAVAFEGWQGQEQNTPLMGFTSSAVSDYDAGQGFGTRQTSVGSSTGFFPQ